VLSLAAARATAEIGLESLELVVVDNDCADLDAERLRLRWPDLLLIRNASNVGFGPAVNQGVAACRGEIVLLLNPDTVAEGQPFDAIVAAFAAEPELVAAAPRLIDTDVQSEDEPQGTFQLRRLPTLAQAARELLLVDKLWPDNPWLRRDRYLDRDPNAPLRIEQPAAAAFAVRRASFLGIGGFDEAFTPAWFEDVDLCRRLLAQGEIRYLPACAFVHRGGEAARRLGYDVFLPIYYRNAHRYWRKHHGALAAACYRVLVAKGMALRLLVLPLRRGMPRPRSEAARAYLRVLRGALGLDRSFAIPATLRRTWARRGEEA
jgi:N-acetylglucosaminyl-diphospho-decaprenol L-rhamnosyltransferase